MRRTRQIEEDSIAGINIAPVINVALVLVLILMITTPIINMPSIPVNLPKAVTIEAKERNISVTYANDGRVAINTQVVSWEQLIPRLRSMLKRDPKVLVIIRADRDVPYGEVEKIFDLVVKHAGAKRIAVATEQKRLYKEGSK